ncbi:hypothetical protein EDD83_01565 [Methanohalophilus euhalobius]|uniref:AAA+ ATPase domain-containing protein n=2 Tax=Methanohalophilus euhalobius TaxID=51203 RepID=A0A3M9LG71_9EURY|nr:hypothetical protein EDD83_01565 [Methanohalophilus euhalobius]
MNMGNKWFIRPGEKGRLWNEFLNNKCIGIGWDGDESYSGYESLDDVKQSHGTNDANSIWYFYNDMSEGDVVIAVNGQNTVLGIGKITSNYLEPQHPENPGIEYLHTRLVHWLINEQITLSYNLANKTITPVNEEWKWEEIKNGYIQMNNKYKDIFAQLENGDKMDISQLVKYFISQLDSDELKNHRKEHIKSSEMVREKLTNQYSEALTEEEMLEILNDTDAAYGARYNIESIFANNGGFDNLKVDLITSLESTKPNENDINQALKSFNNMGIGFLSELLCLKEPNNFWIKNSVVDDFFSRMNIDIKGTLPYGSKGDQGEYYIAMKPHMSNILQNLKINGLKDATYMDVDLFLWWLKDIDVPNITTQNKSLLHNTLVHTKNVILYGPPGTGKTYAIQQFTKSFLKDQLSKPKSFEEMKIELLQDLKWYQVVALSIYLNGKNETVKVPDLKNHDIIKFYFEKIRGRERNFSQTLWGQLQSHSNPNSETVKTENKSSPTLFDKASSSEWYLLPEGIEYVENNLSEAIDLFTGNKQIYEEKDFGHYCTFITFHQSYGYEDFIEGLKPIVYEGDVSYKVESGVFKDICERAKNDPENNYVLVIDEINRGNIAKIFGELITLIEDDKRSGKSNEISIKLPYSKTDFSVPSNLYIVGTMNTADRSIALLDIALRRRFTFLEMMPDYSIIDVEIDGVNIGSLLKELNGMLSALIDRDHQIGHSYFCEVVELEEEQAKNKLYFVWYNRVIPLLQEYFYNDWEQLKMVLGDFVVEKDNNSILEDRLVSKNYEIKNFENDWSGFSTALNKVYLGGELTGDIDTDY